MTNDTNDHGLAASNDPEIMDEFQWEEFMKKADERAEKFGQLMEKYADHPDSEKIIAREMGWIWLLEALEAQEKGEPQEDDSEEDDHYEDDDDEGEEWKKSTGFVSREIDDLHLIPAYQVAHEFALRAIELIRSLPESHQSEKCIGAFIEGATIPAAKIAGGFGFGYEMQRLGGNIANCKRGLAMANQCLTALQEMKEKQLIGKNTFIEIMSQAKEMRDALALHIADLRERFQRGIP